MRALRNILIIMVLAAGVAFLPGGGNITTAVFSALSLAFLTVITLAAWRFLKASEFTLLAMPDRARIGLYGALGLIVFLFAGAGRMWSSGLGTLLWIVLLGTAVVAVWRIWAEARAI